jgi:N-acetylglucosamine malate deacetylase 1
VSLIDRIGTALVIAPHPDDEVLGCGGTIARIARSGRPADVAIVTRGMAPAFAPSQVDAVRAEAAEAHAMLGVRHTHYLDFPAAGLDRTPQAELNAALRQVIVDVAPDTIFVPFRGDIHIDHRLVFDSALVASRPNGGFRPSRILAYETLSETNWSAPHVTPAFIPNIFIGIEGMLDVKLAAFRAYASQCQPFPHERSVEALRALAMLRGACVNLPAAEAFVLLREIDSQ